MYRTYLYGTHMPPRSRTPRSSPEVLHDVDDALVRLRRLWSPGRSSAIDDAGRVVEMSSLLVVEAVARHASSGGTASVGDVAAFCDVEHSTASRLVDRGVRSGLVVRAPSRQDTRRSALTLTADGAVVRDRATAFRTRWLAEVLSQWSPDDVTAFAAALRRFADGVERVPLRQG